jgi:hypothetical protein
MKQLSTKTSTYVGIIFKWRRYICVYNNDIFE